MTDLYAISIHSLDNKSINKWLTYIPQYLQVRVRNFQFDSDKKRSMLGSLLVRYHVVKNKLIEGNKYNIQINEFGKPFCTEINKFNFNISHSGEWVVCACGDSELGIDIEHIEEIDLNIAKNYFCYTEFMDILNCRTKYERTKMFYRYWTAKESYVKYLGKGLSLPLNSFCIENNRYDANINQDKTINLKTYFYDKDYVITVCSKTLLDSAINVLEYKDILNMCL